MRRLRSQKTMSIRGQRTFDPSVSSYCGSWGKEVMERYSHTYTHTHFARLCVHVTDWIVLTHNSFTVNYSLHVKCLSSSHAGISSSKSCWSCIRKDICNESFKKGTKFMNVPFTWIRNTQLVSFYITQT